jgi:hypothetical protein
MSYTPFSNSDYNSTLLECDFSNPSYRQCDLSRIDGFNVGMSFSFDSGSCGGNSCSNNGCDGNAAFSTPTNGYNSLRQCNVANVGMQSVSCSLQCHYTSTNSCFLSSVNFC